MLSSQRVKITQNYWLLFNVIVVSRRRVVSLQPKKTKQLDTDPLGPGTLVYPCCSL
jgi:hypothetical protein